MISPITCRDGQRLLLPPLLHPRGGAVLQRAERLHQSREIVLRRLSGQRDHLFFYIRHRFFLILTFQFNSLHS